MSSLDGRVTAASVRVDHNGCCAIKNAFVRGPAVQVHHWLHAGYVTQAFLQQQTTGLEFMFAGTMALTSSDQNNFFGFRRRNNNRASQKRGHSKSVQSFHS